MQLVGSSQSNKGTGNNMYVTIDKCNIRYKEWFWLHVLYAMPWNDGIELKLTKKKWRKG